MFSVKYSLVVPVYNRPEQIRALLESLIDQKYSEYFEVIVVEDGSTESSQTVVADYRDKIKVLYYYKDNTGPGDSRNFGVKKAKGEYLIFVDSDCVLPKDYFAQIDSFLEQTPCDCFGGYDTMLSSFSKFQKAVNCVMTSILSTGGIRGKKNSPKKFQPRSFNMGIKKEVFNIMGGFVNIHPGEDPDLVFRLWKEGYSSAFAHNLKVFHKRRTNVKHFFWQMYRFGQARAILNFWHKDCKRFVYWLPTFFSFGLIFSLLVFGVTSLPLWLYVVYFTLVFLESTWMTKRPIIGLFASVLVFVQFFGYGWGFLSGVIKLKSGRAPELLFPHLFFHKNTPSDS